MKSTDLRYHPQATTIIAECELLRWRIAKGLYSCRSCIEDVLLLFVFARAEHHPALLLNVSACKFCWVELHSDQYLCQFCIILHPLHAEYGAGSNWQPLVACVIVGSTFSPNPPLLAIQTNCSSTSIAVHKCPAWINALISFLISRLSFGHALGLWHFLRRQVTKWNCTSRTCSSTSPSPSAPAPLSQSQWKIRCKRNLHDEK